MKNLSKTLAVLFLALPAWADEGGPCQDEIGRLCPKAEGPARMHCLESRKAELSPACHEHVSRMRDEGEQFKQDCREDSAKFCPELEGRKLMDCLKASSAKLSPACGKRVHKIHAGHKSVKERIPAACREDSEKLCPPDSVPPEGIRACLKAAAEKLGEACRKALKP